MLISEDAIFLGVLCVGVEMKGREGNSKCNAG